MILALNTSMCFIYLFVFFPVFCFIVTGYFYCFTYLMTTGVGIKIDGIVVLGLYQGTD